MVKVVVAPAATGEVGVAVTVKSAALVPLMTTSGEPVKAKAAVPLLVMVNVCVTGVPMLVLPKSVPSVVEGLVSPLLIGVLDLPVRSISGATPVPCMEKV